MAGQRHFWKQFMDPAPKYACFAGYRIPRYYNSYRFPLYWCFRTMEQELNLSPVKLIAVFEDWRSAGRLATMRLREHRRREGRSRSERKRVMKSRDERRKSHHVARRASLRHRMYMYLHIATYTISLEYDFKPDLSVSVLSRYLDRSSGTV